LTTSSAVSGARIDVRFASVAVHVVTVCPTVTAAQDLANTVRAGGACVGGLAAIATTPAVLRVDLDVRLASVAVQVVTVCPTGVTD
jgi:hypothetical protein